MKILNITFSLIIYTSLIFLSTDGNTASKVDKLQKEVKKLEKKINALSKKQKKIDKKTDSVKTKGGNLSVKNKKKSKTFTVGGMFQSDINIFDGAYNANNNGEQGSDIFARRIRLSIGGKYELWDYKMLLDFSNDEDFDSNLILSRLRYLGFKDGPIIKFGKIREDISLEALSGSKHLISISRSMLANTFSPYYQWGIAAYQNFDSTGLRYAVGIYKGTRFGATGTDENDNITLSVTGRLTWAPIKEKDHILHLGVWGNKREFAGDELFMRARGELRSTNVRLLNYARGGQRYDVRDMEQTGLELAYVYGPLSLQSEVAVRKINAVLPEFSNSYEAEYIQISYFLTGDHRRYSSNAHFYGPLLKGKDSAWEIFWKNSSFDSISDDNLQGTDVIVNTVGVNYHYSSKIKFMLNKINAEVSGPGTNSLVGQYDTGDAYSFRVQYSF